MWIVDIIEFDGSPSLDASKIVESTKCPWMGVVEGTVGATCTVLL